MPPKRTRATATRSTRTTSSVAPSDPAPPTHSNVLRKAPAAAVAAQDDSIEDDSSTNGSEALLITNRARGGGRATRRGQRPEEGYKMTGALGDGSTDAEKTAAAGKKPVRTKGRIVPKKVQSAGQSKALEGLKRRREEAMRAKEERGNGDAVEEHDNDDDAPAAAETERGRRRAPSSPPQTVNRVRRASSSHFAAAPPSAVKAQGTPAADNTSILALTKFKRRPRQPSLLRMMQQSDVENDDDTLDDSTATLDYSLGDFEPDHESTPLNLNKNAARGVAAAAPGSEPRTSSSRKRKMSERERDEVSVLQVPRSSPPIMDEEQEEQPVAAVQRETSSEHLYSEASDLPDVIAATQPEHAENEEEDEATEGRTTAIGNDTMAPPRSTSPLSSAITVEIPQEAEEEEEEEAPAKRPRRAVRNTTTTAAARARAAQQQQTNDYDDDPLSSSASDSNTAVETPMRRGGASRRKTAAGAAGKRKPKTMSLSTATLQSLLPRRRKMPGAKGAFEISSDNEEEEGDEDEDELQRAPAPAKKGGKKAGKAVGGGKKRLSKTYGRRLSDKENQQDGSDADDAEKVEARNKSKELAAAARKFAEVDEWEMEFESVDMGGASASSPWR